MLTTNAHINMLGFKKPGMNSPKTKPNPAMDAAHKAIAMPDFRRGSITCIKTRMLHNIYVDMNDKEGHSVFCVAFSNDSGHLATTTADGLAIVYDHHGRFC